MPNFTSEAIADYCSALVIDPAVVLLTSVSDFESIHVFGHHADISLSSSIVSGGCYRQRVPPVQSLTRTAARHVDESSKR